MSKKKETTDELYDMLLGVLPEQNRELSKKEKEKLEEKAVDLTYSYVVYKVPGKKRKTKIIKLAIDIAANTATIVSVADGPDDIHVAIAKAETKNRGLLLLGREV